MTSGIDPQIYGRQVHQEYDRDANGHTHINLTRTIETVNNRFGELRGDSYQDGYFHDRVGSRPYQEKGKADRDDNTGARGLLGSFILMLLASSVASTLFPVQSIQSNTSTSTLDITPVVIPMQSMGFN